MNQTIKDVRKSCQENVNQLGQAYCAMYDEIEKKLRRDVHAGEALESALLDFSSMLLEAEAAGLRKDEIFPDGLDRFYEELTEALPLITKEDRKRKKKLVSMSAVAIIVAVVLCWFGSKWIKMSLNTYVEGQDHPYMYQSLIGGRTVSYAKGEKDYYFQRGKYLYRFDPDTKKVSPLCTREDCLHSRQPDPIQYDICNANVVGDDFDKLNVAYWDGYVYYINHHKNGYYTLNRVKEDGSEAETVKKWTHCTMDCWRWIIHRGYLYFMRSEDVKDEYGSSEEEIYIKRMSLKDPEKEEILYRIEDDGPNMMFLQTVTAYGNQVYFMIFGGSSDDRCAMAGLYRYDLSKKEMKEIVLPEEYDMYMLSQITFLQDQLVIMAATYKNQTETTDNCFVSDLDGKNMRVYSKQEFEFIHGDGKYLYCMEIPDEGEEGHGTAIFHICDIRENNIDSMSVDVSYIAGGSLSDYSNISLGDEDGMFWIISSHERKMWDIYWIDKDQIGSWKGKKLELEPVDQLRYGYAYVKYLTGNSDES